VSRADARATQAARRMRRRGSSWVLAWRRLVLGSALIVMAAGLIATPGAAGGRPVRGVADSQQTLSAAAKVERLLNGIPQSGNVLGYRHAPVTLQVFGDLECPICREFALGAQVGLIRRYVRTGKLKIVARSLETATRQPATFLSQQVAALAAGAQRKMWYFVELFYREQGREDSGYVTEAYLRGLARQVPGLDIAEWSAVRNNPVFVAEIASDAQTADRRGFDGTPAFLIGRTGGHLHTLENPPLEEPAGFEAAIRRLLRARR
jgi:protein-disulfide isomerase